MKNNIEPIKPLVRKLPLQNLIVDSVGNVFLYWLFERKMQFLFLCSTNENIEYINNLIKQQEDEHYFRKNN